MRKNEGCINKRLDRAKKLAKSSSLVRDLNALQAHGCPANNITAEEDLVHRLRAFEAKHKSKIESWHQKLLEDLYSQAFLAIYTNRSHDKDYPGVTYVTEYTLDQAKEGVLSHLDKEASLGGAMGANSRRWADIIRAGMNPGFTYGDDCPTD